MPDGTGGFLMLPVDHPGTCLPEALLMCQHDCIFGKYCFKLNTNRKIRHTFTVCLSVSSTSILSSCGMSLILMLR